MANLFKSLKGKEEMKLLLRLSRLLNTGSVYRDSPKLHEPVGLPSELINDEYLRTNPYWKEPDLEVFHEIIRRDPAPIPATINRDGYNEDDHLGYWVSGYADFRKTLEVVGKYGCKAGRLLDFGGSSGRVFRHFAFQSSAWDVWSCDFNPASVQFNQRYFPTSIKPFLNGANPSLPLVDGEFDLVTAYSVFTHIDKTEIPWLLELRRILRVGGIAYLSVHDSNTWLNPSEDLRSWIKSHRPDLLRQSSLPPGRTVINPDPMNIYSCQVFHDEDYIRCNWGRFFRILEIRPMWMDRHAVVVCQRVS